MRKLNTEYYRIKEYVLGVNLVKIKVGKEELWKI